MLQLPVWLQIHGFVHFNAIDFRFEIKLFQPLFHSSSCDSVCFGTTIVPVAYFHTFVHVQIRTPTHTCIHAHTNKSNKVRKPLTLGGQIAGSQCVPRRLRKYSRAHIRTHMKHRAQYIGEQLSIRAGRAGRCVCKIYNQGKSCVCMCVCSTGGITGGMQNIYNVNVPEGMVGMFCVSTHTHTHNTFTSVRRSIYTTRQTS